MTLLLVLLSIFWSSAGVLRSIFTGEGHDRHSQGRAKVVEKLVQPVGRRAGPLVVLVQQHQYPVPQEREQVKKAVHLAGMVLPVAEIVLEVVPALHKTFQKTV